MTDQPQPPMGAPPPAPPAYGQPTYGQPTYGQPAYGQPAFGGTPTQPYGVPPQPYDAVPAAYGAVPMQARGLAPATLAPLPKRRRGLLFTGIAVLAAGVIAAAVLFVVSLTMTEKTVEKFARAPSGCTTTLDFSKQATFTLYVETKGSAGIGSGSCPGNGASYDRGDDDLPQVSLSLVDGAGQQVPMSAVSSPTYSAGAFAGQAVQQVEITEPGSYRLTVTSDATDFAIAVGGDPDADATAMVNAGIGALALGLLVGGILIALGMRKKAPPVAAAPAPGWPQAVVGNQGWMPQPTVPGAVATYPTQQAPGYPPQQAVPPMAPNPPPAPPSGPGWSAPQQ